MMFMVAHLSKIEQRMTSVIQDLKSEIRDLEDEIDRLQDANRQHHTQTAKLISKRAELERIEKFINGR